MAESHKTKMKNKPNVYDEHVGLAFKKEQRLSMRLSLNLLSHSNDLDPFFNDPIDVVFL